MLQAWVMSEYFLLTILMTLFEMNWVFSAGPQSDCYKWPPPSLDLWTARFHLIITGIISVSSHHQFGLSWTLTLVWKSAYNIPACIHVMTPSKFSLSNKESTTYTYICASFLSHLKQIVLKEFYILNSKCLVLHHLVSALSLLINNVSEWAKWRIV